MLSVGIDSYITCEEALTSLLAWRGAEARDLFQALPEETQEALLRRATHSLDSHEYVGVKADADQPLKWPRRDYGMPSNLKIATALEALRMLQQGAEQAQIATLAKAGVTSYSLSDFSVSIDAKTAAASAEKLDHEIKSLLRDYLRRGGPINVY